MRQQLVPCDIPCLLENVPSNAATRVAEPFGNVQGAKFTIRTQPSRQWISIDVQRNLSGKAERLGLGSRRRRRGRAERAGGLGRSQEEGSIGVQLT